MSARQPRREAQELVSDMWAFVRRLPQWPERLDDARTEALVVQVTELARRVQALTDALWRVDRLLSDQDYRVATELEDEVVRLRQLLAEAGDERAWAGWAEARQQEFKDLLRARRLYEDHTAALAARMTAVLDTMAAEPPDRGVPARQLAEMRAVAEELVDPRRPPMPDWWQGMAAADVLIRRRLAVGDPPVVEPTVDLLTDAVYGEDVDRAVLAERVSAVRAELERRRIDLTQARATARWLTSRLLHALDHGVDPDDRGRLVVQPDWLFEEPTPEPPDFDDY